MRRASWTATALSDSTTTSSATTRWLPSTPRLRPPPPRSALERIVATRRGDQVAGEYALGQVQEVLVHGWDLAKATGQDTKLPADVVDVAYARALRNHDRIRATGA